MSFATFMSFFLEAGVTTVSYLIFSCCYLFRTLGGVVVSVLFCIRPDLSMGPETIYPATPGQRASYRPVSKTGSKPVIGNHSLSPLCSTAQFRYHSSTFYHLDLSSPSVTNSLHFPPHLSLYRFRHLSSNHVNGTKQPDH